MQSLTLPSPAKLNLFLHITGRRADGYHLLQTVFQFLDYADTITLSLRKDKQICRQSDLKGVPADEDLVIKAAKLLAKHTDFTHGIDIHVDKQLPMGGGLGGGSSNAATVLLGLNKLWNNQLSIDQLAKLGLQLGADVPIFVRGGAAWAEGVGEKIHFVEIPEPWYLIIQPNVSVSTAEIFLDEGLTRDCEPIRIPHFLAGHGRNVFEPVVRKKYPEIDEAMNWLSNHSTAKLTGTGSCVFAEFSSEDQAKKAFDTLPSQWKGKVSKGKNISPLKTSLSE